MQSLYQLMVALLETVFIDLRSTLGHTSELALICLLIVFCEKWFASVMASAYRVCKPVAQLLPGLSYLVQSTQSC